VLCFALSVSLLTGLLVGILPALQSTRVDLNEALKEGGRTSSAGWGGRRVRSALVVSQVALSLVLMVCAGLLIRSFVNVLKVPKGFSTDNVLTVSLSLPPAHYPTPEVQREFFRQMLERLESQPLFESVGVTNKAPLNKTDVIGLLFDVEGVTPPSDFDQRIALLMSASSDYFRTMGITIVQGRYFSPSDTQGAPPVIIINEGLARRYFPDGEALGKRVKVFGEKQPREIVGVVNDVRSLGLEQEKWQEMFLPYLQGGPRPTTLVLRCAAAPSTALRAVQETVNGLDKDLPLYDGKTMRQQVYDSVAQRSYLLWLMGTLAVIALLLTTSGIYGVISYSVTQRTREIGIRLALGAPGSHVLRLVMRETLWLVALGLGIGVLTSLAATRWLVSLLYGLKENDPITMAAAALLLMSVALWAGWFPARRATKVHPMVALRCE
jgi:predicted permease